jgi:hypothetical protein
MSVRRAFGHGAPVAAHPSRRTVAAHPSRRTVAAHPSRTRLATRSRRLKIGARSARSAAVLVHWSQRPPSYVIPPTRARCTVSAKRCCAIVHWSQRPPSYVIPPTRARCTVSAKRCCVIRVCEMPAALSGVPEPSERRSVGRLAELLKGPLANLPNPLPRHAEQRADLFEGHGL